MVERENIHLYARLVDCTASDSMNDPQFSKLTRDMERVKARIESRLLVTDANLLQKTEKADLTRLLQVLEEALGKSKINGGLKTRSKTPDASEKIKDLIGL